MTYIDTRTFKSGDGVAVPLPAEFGIDEDTPVRIERSGDRIIVIPIRPDRDWLRDRERLLADLKALGPIVPREERDTDPIFERPGSELRVTCSTRTSRSDFETASANCRGPVAALPLSTSLSVVTVVELMGGLNRNPAVAAQRVTGLEYLLRSMEVLPFDGACAEAYGRIVVAADYSRPRILDRMIAATALVHGLTLVTANAPDFAGVPGLAMEVWAAA